MARICPSVTPQPGVNVPAVETLRTGDLLFPRCATTSVLETAAAPSDPGDAWSAALRARRLSEALGPALSALVHPDAHADLAARLGSTPQTVEALRREAPPGEDARRMALLLAILRVEFAPLIRDWFNLSVDDFKRHKLARVLMRAFDGDIDDGFFVGHCAMVLRENDGAHTNSADGRVWVIEANATSFSHYGVAIHPYQVENDGQDGHLRGWAAARAAKGDAVWHARHRMLADDADQDRAEAIRHRIVPLAKAYLGRGYSFFESAVFGDAERLYCSELLHNIVRDTGELDRVDTLRTWQWMKANNPPRRPGDIGHAIADAWQDERIRAYVEHRDFFILTVQMLWRSPSLQLLLMPGGRPYDEA